MTRKQDEIEKAIDLAADEFRTEMPQIQRVVPNIYMRISAIMAELDYIQKGTAKVNGQYRFVSHDQVTEKIHPLLVKHGVVILPTVEESIQDNNRTEVKLLMQFINIDVPTDVVTIRTIGYGIDGSDKGPGKAISYAYKYGILKTFCLETGDDPDQDQSAVYEPVKPLDFEDTMRKVMALESPADVTIFVKHCAENAKMSENAIMEAAIKKPVEFRDAFYKWKKSK
jgi:hypothetical protein